MTRNCKLTVLAFALLFAASRAWAQGDPSFVGAPASGGGNPAADEGLEGATPTDNVNELNSGNAAPGLNGAAPVNDFPAANDAKDFDIGNNGNSGGDDFFTNDGGNPTGANPAQAAPSAFGGGSNPAAANNTAPKNAAPTQTINAAPANPVPAVNNAPPANAQTLMNQLNQTPTNAAPTNAPTNAAPANAVPATAPVNEQDNALTPQNQGPPAIEAPPLPPPNEFAGAPPVPGTMRLMADGEAPEEYKVDPGDTLFDICDQLLDEPAYWPKLWALNPEIKNPHFIFPNMRLRFYPGDDETPPYLQVVTEDDVIPIDKGDLDEGQLVAEKVNFTEEAVEEQLVEVIGPDQVDPPEDADLVIGSGRIYAGSDVQLQVPGFIFHDPKEPLGYVIGGRDGEVSLQPDQRAIVESVGGLSNGTLYTVLRPGEEIENPESGDFVGFKYYFVANVRMDKQVDSGDNAVFLGTVRDSRLSVRPDDIVVSFISTQRSIPSGDGIGSLGSAKANVVGFEYHMQEIGAQGNYAFIDKGNGDGVSAGMYLPVYQTPGYLSTAFGNTELPEDYELVGVIRVIDTTDAGAVGYIVRNTKELRIGDRAGGKG